MDSQEAYDLIAQLNHELAAEPDPDVRAWYRVESELQPEIVEAKKVVIGDIATLIGKLANSQTQEHLDGTQDLQTETEIVEPPHAERPQIQTEEEILRQRIKRKYQSCLRTYQSEMSEITVAKKSKREKQELIARRNFARSFTDLSDITGDEHIVLRANLLNIVAADICDNEALLNEIFANSADYAHNHVLEVVADPKNFASIISGSAAERPNTEQFETILKKIFSSDAANYPNIHLSLANAAFELLEDFDALDQVVDIAYLRKPYTTTAFYSELLKHDMQRWLDYDVSYLVNNYQINAVYGLLNVDITGLNYRPNEKIQAAERSTTNYFQGKIKELSDARLEKLWQLLPGGQAALAYDPVEVIDLDGTNTIDMGLKATPEEYRKAFENSELFHKRMQQLAPFSYGVRAAKEFIGRGVHSNLVIVSPSVTIEIYTPDKTFSDTEIEDYRQYVDSIMPELLTIANKAKLHGMSTFEESGTLRLLYHPLDQNDKKKGVIILRPTVPLDKRVHTSLAQLSVNFEAIRESRSDENLPYSWEELYQSENIKLREIIKNTHERFLGRRSVKFSMPHNLKKSGLQSIRLRYDPKSNTVRSNFILDDGEVELTLDRDFNIDTSGSIAPYGDAIGRKTYYENLILKLVDWSCNREVSTSEGVISEHSGHTANFFGHFAYLRVREDDRKYMFSETQRQIFIEEQGGELALESEQRKSRDESGQERNSTYVREYFDPSQPPLEVYNASLE